MIPDSAVRLAHLIRTGELRAQEVVEYFLHRIKEKDEQLRAFITVCEKEALAQAQALDEGAPARQGPLAGVPVAVKDNIVTRGIRTTCASRILENFYPPYEATVVEKLKRAGAIIIGKTNLDEFAMGSSTENSAFFPTRNPWNLDCVPGGSSGGSAAAVAAREVPLALGSDTGGSVRQPAAFCGLVGLKPTYGRVSRYGLVAFASSLDQIGPLTRSVEDCALLTQVIAGQDHRDSTTAAQPVPDYLTELAQPLTSLRIGLISGELLEGIDPEVRTAFERIINYLEKEGAQFEEIEFSSWKIALPCYYVIAPSEASSNLARYDGVRYGFRDQKVNQLRAMYEKTRTKGFGPEVKRRIILGTFALSAGYYEAYYGQATRARHLIAREFSSALKKVDFILTPTTPEPAFRFGAKADPLAMYLSDIFTVTANLAGVPAISLPVGMTKEGLPIGLQIIGDFFQESQLFRLAFLLEKKVEFRKEYNKII